MKILSKIKLINWMYFANQTIEIKGNTLITGANGTGKSTIIDALQYLLLGGKKGLKFNSAANDQGKRTLESYVRGKITIEGQEYLRGNSCIGHIAIEISDEGQSSDIIGVVLDMSRGEADCRSVFYKIESAKIDDDFFVNKKENGMIPKNYDEIKRFAASLGKKVERFESTIAYRAMLKTFLGVDAEKYSKLLPNAIAVGSVTKMENFITDFLLEENPVEVKDLQENISNMKRLSEKIALDEKKLKELEVVLETGEVIRQKKEKIKIIELAKIMAVVKDLKWKIAGHENDLKKLRNEKVFNEEAIKQKKLAEESQTGICYEIDKSLGNDVAYQKLESIDKEISSVVSRLEEAEIMRDEAKTLLKEIKSNIEKLTINENYLEFKEHISKLDIKVDSISISQAIDFLSEQFANHMEMLSTEKKLLIQQQQENTAKVKKNNEVLENLKKNIKNYPQYVVTLITQINNRLSMQYGKKIEVRPLCEFVGDVDAQWRNAIEGYLNTQRFDIVCDPKYFDDCLEIYEEIKYKQKIYGIGVVNTEKYYEDALIVAGTLSDKISFTNKFARNYAYSILNRVFCADISNLKTFANSITKTCMRYSNHVARQIAPEVYQTLFLGLESNKLTIVSLERENEQLLESYKKISDNLYNSDRKLSLFKRDSLDKLHYDRTLISSIDLIKQLEKDKANYEKIRKELAANPTYIDLKEKQHKQQVKLRKIRDDLISLEANTKNILRDVEKNYDTTAKLLNMLEFEEKNFEVEQIENRTLMFEVEKRYQESAKDKIDLQALLSTFEKSKNSYSTEKAQNELASLMAEFCIHYNFGAGKNYESLLLYQLEKNKISDENLIRYKDELNDITFKTNKMFEENFLIEIKRRIKNCYDQIDELNKQLKEKKFGDDQYNIKCSPTLDLELQKYYKLIMDKTYDDLNTLFADQASDKYQQDFNKMISEITESAAKGESSRLLDYRKYLHFDIQITGKSGTRNYSDLKHVQSGGESQVPFYIVAAVSFQNLLTKGRNNQSNLCIVLFDEAFNNMDPQRIKTMMEFYKNLNLQIFLSLTGEKIGNIVQYMDSTIAVIRDGNIVTTKEFAGALSYDN